MTTCDVIAQLSLVSRQHARIERQGVRYLLTDLGSANGTYVNGQRLAEPRLLLDGDLIGLGSNTPALRFTDPDATNFTPALLVFDERMLQFFVGQTPVTLTPSQHRFLVHLYRNQGRVCTREECAEAVWGNQRDPGADVGRLDQLVSAVRLALRKAAGDQAEVVEKISTFIQARRGLGYSLQL
jgi:DNA-binding response OmpR family regulator